MDYKKHYELLIKKLPRSKSKISKTPHRIIPGSLGGTYSAENVVWVTAKQHYLAHALLAKIYGGAQWLSLFRTGHFAKKKNSALYLRARKERSALSKKVGNDNVVLKRGIYSRTQEEVSNQNKKSGRLGGLKGGKVSSAQKYRCLGCEVITFAAPMKNHQKASGHKGRERVS